MLDRLWIQLAQVPETLSSNSCRLLFSISVPICTLKSLSLSSLCNLCAWQSIVRQLNGHCVWACLYRRDYVVMPPWNWSNETQIKIYSIYFSTDTKWHLRACGTSVFAITFHSLSVIPESTWDFCLRWYVHTVPVISGSDRDFCLRWYVHTVPVITGSDRDFCWRWYVHTVSVLSGSDSDFCLRWYVYTVSVISGSDRDFCLRWYVHTVSVISGSDRDFCLCCHVSILCSRDGCFFHHAHTLAVIPISHRDFVFAITSTVFLSPAQPSGQSKRGAFFKELNSPRVNILWRQRCGFWLLFPSSSSRLGA